MHMMKRFFLSLMTMLGIGLAAPAVHAEVNINVTQGNVEAIPFAIGNFYAEAGPDRVLAMEMPTVIGDDLTRSGLFQPMNPKSFVQDTTTIHTQGVRFAEWRAINATVLISGAITRTGNGQVRVEYRLWDVTTEKQLMGMAYTTDNNNWRRIAHIIADDIYKRMTGEEGYFDTRIVYIAESGPANRRIKRLAIMDQDGQNHRYLTGGEYMVLTPRFSPNTQTITYLSYYQNKPRVYIYDLNTGRQSVVGDFPGMTFAPRFSPDGRTVVMSMAQSGNTDIYTMDIGTRQVTRLTSTMGIDTSPSFSPDGRQITFESDRGGTQQIYVMDANGNNARRISFGQGRYGTPVWSPRGDLIAFTKLVDGTFYIGVMRPDGSGERLITQAFHVEGPTWAPNGRVLMYFKEKPVDAGGMQKSARIYSIDITGYNERVLPTPGDASDPAWSPVIP